MSSQSSTIAEPLSQISQLFAQRPDVPASALAVIGLGANLPSGAGLPADTLRAVLPALQSLSATPVVVSTIIETEPDDCPPGSPRFANAVAVICPLPGLTPLLLLEALQALEAEFGRRRKGIRNEARPLDLDIISVGAWEISTDRLVLPHARARQRSFVMEPLAQIWPEFRFPGAAGTEKTAAEIAETLRSPA